mgnify:CR=1 FL=1
MSIKEKVEEFDRQRNKYGYSEAHQSGASIQEAVQGEASGSSAKNGYLSLMNHRRLYIVTLV